MQDVMTLSLRTLKEVLLTPTPPVTDPNYARIFSAKKDAAASGIGMGLKADENCLRVRKQDVLDKLWASLQNIDAARAQVINA